MCVCVFLFFLLKNTKCTCPTRQSLLFVFNLFSIYQSVGVQVIIDMDHHHLHRRYERPQQNTNNNNIVNTTQVFVYICSIARIERPQIHKSTDRQTDVCRYFKFIEQSAHGFIANIFFFGMNWAITEMCYNFVKINEYQGGPLSLGKI